MCFRGRPRGQGRPRGLHLCYLYLLTGRPQGYFTVSWSMATWQINLYYNYNNTKAKKYHLRSGLYCTTNAMLFVE